MSVARGGHSRLERVEVAPDDRAARVRELGQPGEVELGARVELGGELLPFGLSDMSTRIQQVTNEWRDKLFESNNGSLCPLNDYEMQRFEQQLAAISNFEDMSGHPKERGRQIAGLYVNLTVLKHRIFGKKHDARQGSMVPYSSAPVGDDHTTALLKHSRNNDTRFEWQKITEEGYELIMKEIGLKKVTAYHPHDRERNIVSV